MRRGFVKLGIVHFALRENRRLTGVLLETVAVAGVWLVAVVVGPFGTFDQLTTLERMQYWGMSIVLNLGLGMNPALVGLLGALPRLVDAFTDPLMGYISDNTRSRWGRRRPYIFAGAILAEKSEHFTFAQLEAEICHCHLMAKCFSKVLKVEHKEFADLVLGSVNRILYIKPVKGSPIPALQFIAPTLVEVSCAGRSI